MREFLVRNQLEPAFHDVRKSPISAEETVALVRKHRKAFARRGASLVALDPATATEADIRKNFLGREGVLRAPTVSNGEILLAGFDETTLRTLFGL